MKKVLLGALLLLIGISVLLSLFSTIFAQETVVGAVSNVGDTSDVFIALLCSSVAVIIIILIIIKIRSRY